MDGGLWMVGCGWWVVDDGLWLLNVQFLNRKLFV